MRKLVLVFIFSIITAIGAKAQSLEIGGFAGVSYYLGDINPDIHFAQSHPAFGGLVRLNLNNRFALRVNGYFGEVSGDDQKRKYIEGRNLKFNSKITDIAATVEFNFLEYYTGSITNYFTPYIFGGIGIIMFNPEADGQNLRNLGTEGQLVGFDGRSRYNKTTLAIPFGFGVKYSINKKLCLGFEWGMRKTFTDYIDDISTTYYLDNINPDDPAQYYSDPTANHKPNAQRGNPKTNDWVNYTGITLTYKIDLEDKSGCSSFQRRKIRRW
ncbi:MAG: DUF6089 family protein [Hyphomicrobiales bacterium]